MLVKELIEELQKLDQNLMVVKSYDFEFEGVGNVSEIFLKEVHYPDDFETYWEQTEESEKGSFPVVYLGS